jgi:hypothetical protein
VLLKKDLSGSSPRAADLRDYDVAPFAEGYLRPVKEVDLAFSQRIASGAPKLR